MNTIKSISEYFLYLETIKRNDCNSNTVSSNTFFRGQSNSLWSVAPRLYREDLLGYESQMLTELYHITPHEFNMNRFDILIKMQHFGLPTRLLDVTTNPLIALYFACCDPNNYEKEGVVFIFINCPVSWSTDPLVELIMDYVFECSSPFSIGLQEILEKSRIKYAQTINRLMPDDIDSLLHYLTIPAFPVMPKNINPRISAQAGACFLFGMKVANKTKSKNSGTFGKEYYRFAQADTDSPDKVWRHIEKIIIPSESKKILMHQLDGLGINEYKLFPDLGHQTKYVSDRIRKSYEYNKGVSDNP